MGHVEELLLWAAERRSELVFSAKTEWRDWIAALPTTDPVTSPPCLRRDGVRREFRNVAGELAKESMNDS
jgi:hypothetical protein